MARIKIDLSIGELIIEFANTADLENQLKNIDISKIESLFEKINREPEVAKPRINPVNEKAVEELGTVNLLKISEGGQDATKLAVFLSANKMSREDVKKITGITIWS